MLRRFNLNMKAVLLIMAGLAAALLMLLAPAAGVDAAPAESMTGALSADETADLLYMREEEKLARDLYLAFYDRYGLPAFSNIAAAEQRHMDAVRYVLEGYGLVDPAGEFRPQGIYSSFVQMRDKFLN